MSKGVQLAVFQLFMLRQHRDADISVAFCCDGILQIRIWQIRFKNELNLPNIDP
jgi:hypothetical protein